ncbi:MAG: hypothetical protein ACYC7L_04200 [Nitrospirota bacterium]
MNGNDSLAQVHRDERKNLTPQYTLLTSYVLAFGFSRCYPVFAAEAKLENPLDFSLYMVKMQGLRETGHYS